MIYLDNGATSFPKPPSVYGAVNRYMRFVGGGAGRSSHKKAREAMEIVTECRAAVAELINVGSPEKIIFTKNATEGLNIIIGGLIKKGDKVVVSPYEHNSGMRPLYEAGAEINILPLDEKGCADVEKISDAASDTAFVIINHVSNVSGAVSDIYRASEICREKNIPLVIDCSQSAGHFDIDVERLCASVVFPGHKGLLGPQGTGVMYLCGISPRPLCFGGTGSSSESMEQPLILPDYYESGTLNVYGIAGLLSGVEFIKEKGGAAEMARHETELAKMLREGLLNMKKVSLVAPKLESFGSVVSFTAENMQPSEIAMLLDENYDIACRSGLHCSPSAHTAYGTMPQGTVRLTPGFFNTKNEIKLTLDAVNTIINKI